MENQLAKIPPQYEKDDFLRKAWISLAQDDVPLDVFELDLEEVQEERYRVFYTSVEYRTTWNAEIGNDRQEPYTDYETYYEKVPYTDYEDKYNSTLRRTERVPVTKYRQEARQRQVTKYRTVTDWHSGSGEYADSEPYLECVDDNINFNRTRFLDDFKLEYMADLSSSELVEQPDMEITTGMMQNAYQKQLPGIERATFRSLPGDHQRSFSYHVVDCEPIFATLVKAPEYKTSLTYNGKKYEKRGFAFGKMTMSRSGIANPISVDAEKKKLEEKTSAENRARDKEVDPSIWNATKLFSLGGIGLLALSIIFSLFVKVLFLVVVAFLGGVGLSIYAMIYTGKVRDRIQRETNDANAEALRVCREAVNNYEQVHKAELLEALNKKLTSLGLEPAQRSDLGK